MKKSTVPVAAGVASLLLVAVSATAQPSAQPPGSPDAVKQGAIKQGAIKQNPSSGAAAKVNKNAGFAKQATGGDDGGGDGGLKSKGLGAQKAQGAGSLAPPPPGNAGAKAAAKVNKSSGFAKQATGGDDGGGDGGLKSNAAIKAQGQGSLAPPPPGSAGAIKSAPNAGMQKSPRDAIK